MQHGMHFPSTWGRTMGGEGGGSLEKTIGESEISLILEGKLCTVGG